MESKNQEVVPLARPRAAIKLRLPFVWPCRGQFPRSTRRHSPAGLFLIRLLLVRHLGEVAQPYVGIAVRRRAPVAARRERAARADLGRVRHRAALELAGLEKALQ